MTPDELMVYIGMAIVPAVTSIACFLALRAVHRKSISVLSSCMVFIIAVLAGMFLSFALVWGFSDLLHGDGALAIIAAPITGAILTSPIALIFAVALTAVASKRAHSRSNSS
jgi:glucose-6-phosphate-specific signal transduction histidine kinase